jgi:hypothetical protein
MFKSNIKEEQQNITWKSYIYAVPRGVMSFGMRASTNSLATSDNLDFWGKVVDATLKLCTEQDKPNNRTTPNPGAHPEQLPQDVGQVRVET